MTEEYKQNGVDIDIPVIIANDSIPMVKAHAIPVMPPAVVPLQGQPTLMKNGRSSRVVVQHDKAQMELTYHQVNALREQGYPAGIINEIHRNSHVFPLRIWVVDNSGSMMAHDGHRIVETLKKENVKLVECSRFSEIQETVSYHSQMAALLKAPTVFRLLNDPGRRAGPQQLSIAERGAEFIAEDLELCQYTMNRVNPSGTTPLTQHVNEIRENVEAMRQELEYQGTKVAIILATDGLPTDYRGYANPSAKADFESALRSLEGLPVWVVVRLCTDDDSVVEYYNSLDSQLELSLEVLDDFLGEAKEVNEHNPWLNYTLPLHRLREMGFNHRLFDLLDERKFTLDEIVAFLQLLFGQDAFDGVPDPQLDFDGFFKSLAVILHREKKQWNPRTKQVEPWIDMKLLKRKYGGEACTIM